jgi:LysR family hca operon transcriptional activator
MELRHLRYFIAVAEEGSVTIAAQRRLNTAQPSLSRQMRELESQVGVPLMTRGPRGIVLTAAGRAFLDHARLAISQADAAVEAAHRAADPAPSSFVMGFVAGKEMEWLPETMQILRGESPNVELVISSEQTSSELEAAVLRGRVDVAFLRRGEREIPEIDYKLLIREPLVVALPIDHRLAAREAIGLHDIQGDKFIWPSNTAAGRSGRIVVDEYFKKLGIEIKVDFEVDSVFRAISLVESIGGIALVPLNVKSWLPCSVITRPLKGIAPTFDLVLGYRKGNISALLKSFVLKTDSLIERVSKRSGDRLRTGAAGAGCRPSPAGVLGTDRAR